MEDFIRDFQNELFRIYVQLLHQYFTGLLMLASIIGTLELLKKIAKDSFVLTIIVRLVELVALIYLGHILFSSP